MAFILISRVYYPGPQWGFDQYTVDAFNRSHDFDVNDLRYADLPAYIVL